MATFALSKRLNGAADKIIALDQKREQVPHHQQMHP